MSTTIIFVFGVFVTLITMTAVLLIGLNEAADPSLTRPEDIAPWESELINRDVKQS